MKGLFTRRNLIRWGLLLLLAWTSVGLLLLRFHGGITVDDVATLEPERPWLAALILLGLFLLKSVDFLLHIGVLFADESFSGLTHPFFASLLNAFKTEAENEDYDLTFINHGVGGDGSGFVDYCRYRLRQDHNP